MDEGGEGGYTEAWKVINEVIPKKKNKGRKKKKGQISGASPQERVNMWFTHFQNLLGNPPSTDMEESELIPAIISDLDINEAYNSVPMLRFFINPQVLIPK